MKALRDLVASILECRRAISPRPPRCPTVIAAALGCVLAGGSIGCSKGSTNARSTDAGSPGPTTPYDSGMASVGALDGAPSTTLPPLPALSNVVAVENDDSASITFDPVVGALDYRVYPLPNNSDINVGSDGAITVKNAIYRCAGNRESPAPNIDGTPNEASAGDYITTQVDNQTVGGYLRTLADATLGYVYTQPGPGLVPVYALGESDPNADDECYFARWTASRTKNYTTSQTERTSLLANFARDDGIAFYVPAKADSTTTQIYLDDQGPGTKFMDRYYFPDGPEAAVHSNKTAEFVVLAKQASGTTPLMRVYYLSQCGWSHDELAVGQEQFNRVYKQGDQQPWWSLLWTGITQPTTLVVEALDTGCPFQGHLSPTSIPSITAYFGTEPLIHQPFVTIDDVRAASPTTEVFINGQHGPAWTWSGNGPDGGILEDAATAAQLLANTGAGVPLPKAIARSFVNVAPKPHPKMDFFAAFSPGSAPETFTTIPCGVPGGNCFATWRQHSATFDQMFIDTEYLPGDASGLFAYGSVMGEWWVTYADVGADTNGKYRLTANQKANMDSSTFLHVTMEADIYATARRYPQILISDQEAPVQYNLVQGHTIVVQPRGEISEWHYWPTDLDLQICNLRTWDVNNQCPQYDLYHVMDSTGTIVHLAPNTEIGEHASVDHRVLFDVFASTQVVYVFLDGQPYACANMPSVGVPSGPVTVTWGDALYHSAVDLNFGFHVDHMQIEQRRHFDNLGFSSGVTAPSWDESRLPCAAPITP
jgi:hypothetical protein